MSPPCTTKPFTMRCTAEPAYVIVSPPSLTKPAHSARKLAAVRGARSSKSSRLTLPAALPSTLNSMKT
eukprot:472000-Pleurochrysis_carterae.AAC.1